MSQKYDKEFKIQTVKMIQEQGKPVAQAARELGVSDNTLYRWINEFKQDPVNVSRQRQSENGGKDLPRHAETNSPT